jgi:large subunit ribosomal protein L10
MVILNPGSVTSGFFAGLRVGEYTVSLPRKGGDSAMGRTLANKREIVADLKHQLSESQVALVIDYRGLSVAEISDLRDRLRPTGTTCMVTKNTLMRIAVEEDEAWQPMTEFLKDSSAFLFLKDDLGGAIKAYQDFQKVTKKTELRGGVMEGRALSESDVKAITDLPTKEELMARIGRALNANTLKVATGLKSLPTKIGVGINEVPSKLARGLKAYAEGETKDAA